MEAFGRFLDVLDELREKCPWDRKQTNESLRPNTIEEVYELSEALMNDDTQDICKELGDVLLHVTFYAKIAEEKGEFDMADVCTRLSDKLVFRHPHVFGNGEVTADTPEQVLVNWEVLKRKEKDQRSTADAIEAVPHIIRSKVTPTAIEYMSRDTILFSESHLGKKFPDTKNDAYILLTFDGNTDAQVEQDMSTVAELCLQIGALDAYIVDTEERKKSVWSARGAFLEAIKASTTEMDECDVVVPGDRVDTFIKFTHELAEKYHVRIPSFGHAGDGNLHVYICRDDLNEEDWEKTLSACFDRMYEKAVELGYSRGIRKSTAPRISVFITNLEYQ